MTSLRDFIESARAELPEETPARWASIFFTLAVLTFLISIAAAQAMLALAAIILAAQLARAGRAPEFPPVKLPLALFCLLSVLSVFWAENSAVGWLAARKLVLFVILLLASNLVVSARHLRWLLHLLFIESALVSVIAAVQFARQYRAERILHPGQVYLYMRASRVHGLMGHWMNFGGQQMLMFAALGAFLLLSPRTRKFWWLAAAMISTSIVLNFTRGVWVGSFLAGIYLLARWRARWLWALPLILLAGFFAAPRLVQKRLESVRHPFRDPSIAIRFEMWQVGARMMEKHPLIGVGPDNIVETYTLYLPPGVIPIVGYRDHLHNNFFQLGAERGLPCLAAWVWLMAALPWQMVRIRRRLLRAPSGESRVWMVDAAIACWIAFVVEGCFEFNFGTSPVLMVFLWMVSIPFVRGMNPHGKPESSELKAQV